VQAQAEAVVEDVFADAATVGHAADLARADRKRTRLVRRRGGRSRRRVGHGSDGRRRAQGEPFTLANVANPFRRHRQRDGGSLPVAAAPRRRRAAACSLPHAGHEPQGLERKPKRQRVAARTALRPTAA